MTTRQDNGLNIFEISGLSIFLPDFGIIAIVLAFYFYFTLTYLQFGV